MSDELSKTSVSELTDTIDRYSGGDPDAVAAGAELARRLAAVEADRDHWKARAEAREKLMDRIAEIANEHCESEGDAFDQIADLGWCGDPVKAAHQPTPKGECDDGR